TASTSSATNAVRQKPPAQPRIVISAFATSSSCFGADEAMTAESPMIAAPTTSPTESTGRRLRRPSSVFVSSASSNERPPCSTCSRPALVVVTSSAFQQPQLVRARHGLEARVDAERAQDVPDVIPDRLLAQMEHGRDVVGRRALAEQLQHLGLAAG